MATNVHAESHLPSLGHRVAELVRAWLVSPVVRWHRRNELYREMIDLDDRTLADIGLTRYDIPYFVRHAEFDAETQESGRANDDHPVLADEDDADHRLAA